MAVTYVASSVGSSGTVTTNLNATVGFPAGITPGDLLLLFAAHNQQAAMTTPAGWTLVRTLTDSTTLRTSVYRRFYQPGDTAPVVVMGATGAWLCDLVAYRGVNTTSPFIAEDGQQEPGVGLATHTSPTLTNTDAAAWLVGRIVSRSPATPQSWTPGSGLTERIDHESGISGAGNLIATTVDSAGVVATGSVAASATMTATSAVATMWAGLLRPNTAPTVDAGPDLAGTVDVEYTRTAVGSDPDGDPLTYTWTVPGDVTVVSGAGTDTLTFKSSVTAARSMSCTATDPSGATATSSFTFTTSSNNAPAASVGAGITAQVGEVVTRVASASDPDGDPLTYAWSAAPVGVVFDGPTDERGASWHATGPDTYTVTFRATDTGGLVGVASLQFAALAAPPAPPAVHIGPQQLVTVGFTTDRTVAVPAGGSVLWTAPDAAGIVPGTGTTDTVTLKPGAVGLYPVTAAVTNADGLSTASTFLLDVRARDAYDVIARIGDRTRFSTSFGTNVEIDLPTQVGATDLLLLYIANNQGASATLPAAWRGIGRQTVGDLAVDLYYRLVGARDVTPTIDLDTGANWIVQVAAWRFLNPINPFAGIKVTVGPTGTVHNFPGLQVANNRQWVACAAAAFGDPATLWTPGPDLVRLQNGGAAGSPGVSSLTGVLMDSRRPAGAGMTAYQVTSSNAVTPVLIQCVLNTPPVVAPPGLRNPVVKHGDSLSADYGLYPGEIRSGQLLADMMQADVIPLGVPGSRVASASATSGAHPPQLTVVGGSIPAARQRVQVTIRQDPEMTLIRDGLYPHAGSVLEGTLNGIHGTLDKISHKDLNNEDWNFAPYYFTRTTPGAAAAVPAQTPFMLDVAAQTQGAWPLIWTGHNDITGDLSAADLDTNLTYVRSRVAEIAAADTTGRMLILGLSGGDGAELGTVKYDAIKAHNLILAATYPGHYLDIRQYLISDALTDLGLTPTADDLLDLANDIPPGTIRQQIGVGNHLSQVGQLALARRIYRFYDESGWLGESLTGETAAINGNPRDELTFGLHVDWNSDGLYDHPLSDMGPWLAALGHDRDYATDLPDQVTQFDGYGTAGVAADLAGYVWTGDGPVEVADWISPYGGDGLAGSARLGVDCWAEVGITGYPPTRVFTGKVRTLDIDPGNKAVHLEALDRQYLLDGTVTLPAAVARYTALDFTTAPEGAEALSRVGINSQWVIEQVLRRAGLYVTRPDRAGVQFAATFCGSGWAHIYNSQRPPFGYTLDPASGARLPLVFSPGGQGHLVLGSDSRRTRYWGELRGAVGTIPGSVTGAAVTIEIGTVRSAGHTGRFLYLRRASIIDSSNMELTGAPQLELYRDGGVLRVRFLRGTSTDVTFDGPAFPDEDELYLQVTCQWTGTRTLTCVMQLGDVTVTATRNDLPIPSGTGAMRLLGIELDEGSMYLGATQVTWEGLAAPARAGFVPDPIDLDPGLNQLLAVPPTIDQVARDVISDVAAAELATAGFDEDGRFYFRNSAHPPTVSLAVLAGDGLLSTTRWREDLAAVRNRIIIPVQPYFIGPTDAELAFPDIWSASEVYEIPPGWRTIDIVLDKSVFVIRTATATGSLLPDGSDGAAVILAVTADLRAAARARIRIFDGYTDRSVYTVDAQGSPTLKLTGVAIEQGDTSEATAEDATSIDTYGLRELRLPASPWMQTQASAQALAYSLLVDTAAPKPVLDAVEVVGDWRIRLGDNVILQDRTGARLDRRCRVQSIRGTGGDGKYTQTLKLREVRSL